MINSGYIMLRPEWALAVETASDEEIAAYFTAQAREQNRSDIGVLSAMLLMHMAPAIGIAVAGFVYVVLK